MEYSLNLSATRFELPRHVEIARTYLRQVGNQVCDQVCGLDSVIEFAIGSITLSSWRANQRPALEMDSVMEFDL